VEHSILKGSSARKCASISPKETPGVSGTVAMANTIPLKQMITNKVVTPKHSPWVKLDSSPRAAAAVDRAIEGKNRHYSVSLIWSNVRRLSFVKKAVASDVCSLSLGVLR
jgi:hypothetical protein